VAQGIKRVRTANGVRYQRNGRFVSAAAYKRSLAAKRRAKSNPRMSKAMKAYSAARTKRVRLRRNPPGSGFARPTRKTKKTRKGPARSKTGRFVKRSARKATIKRPVRRRSAGVKTRKLVGKTKRRKTTGQQRARAAGTRRRYKAATSKAKRKAAPKRRKTVSRKKTTRKTTRRRTVARKSSGRPRYGTKAYYAWLGRKGARARKRKYGSRRTTSRRRAAPKRRRRKLTLGRKRYIGKRGIWIKRKPGGPRRRHRPYKQTVRRGRRIVGSRVGLIKTNPGFKDISGVVKRVAPIYGGFVASRLIRGVVQQHVVNRFAANLGSLPPFVASAMAPALTFLASIFIGPKVLKGTTGRQLLEGLQMGALMTTFDTMLKGAVGGSLPPMLQGAFGGYDDMGVMGYGAYLSDPTGYSLPPAHQTLEPGMGLDVNEAMALDAYVADDGMSGFNAQEALADSEGAYMQSGGAGGSLAKTVFTY
jgi:hypothetical protein